MSGLRDDVRPARRAPHLPRRLGGPAQSSPRLALPVSRPIGADGVAPVVPARADLLPRRPATRVSSACGASDQDHLVPACSRCSPSAGRPPRRVAGPGRHGAARGRRPAVSVPLTAALPGVDPAQRAQARPSPCSVLVPVVRPVLLPRCPGGRPCWVPTVPGSWAPGACSRSARTRSAVVMVAVAAVAVSTSVLGGPTATCPPRSPSARSGSSTRDRPARNDAPASAASVATARRPVVHGPRFPGRRDHRPVVVRRLPVAPAGRSS